MTPQPANQGFPEDSANSCGECRHDLNQVQALSTLPKFRSSVPDDYLRLLESRRGRRGIAVRPTPLAQIRRPKAGKARASANPPAMGWAAAPPAGLALATAAASPAAGSRARMGRPAPRASAWMACAVTARAPRPAWRAITPISSACVGPTRMRLTRPACCRTGSRTPATRATRSTAARMRTGPR
jgi:hypothetical protein